MVYNKTCKICKKEFESESKNKIYCSDKCAKRGAKRSYRSRKMKHIRSKDYPLDKQLNILINKAHTLSREIAEILKVKQCNCNELNHECYGDLEVHHIDHNPFNMEPSNLRWLCKKAHAQLHAQEEDCNFLEELKAYYKVKLIETDNKESLDELFSNEEYARAVEYIFEQFNIRTRNSEKQRERDLDNLNDEDYELFTGEKRDKNKVKHNLTLVD